MGRNRANPKKPRVMTADAKKKQKQAISNVAKTITNTASRSTGRAQGSSSTANRSNNPRTTMSNSRLGKSGAANQSNNPRTTMSNSRLGKSGAAQNKNNTTTQKNTDYKNPNKSSVSNSVSRRRSGNSPIEKTSRQKAVSKIMPEANDKNFMAKGAKRFMKGWAGQSITGTPSTLKTIGAFEHKDSAGGSAAHRFNIQRIKSKGTNDRRTVAQKKLDKANEQKIIKKRNALADEQLKGAESTVKAGNKLVNESEKEIAKDKKGMSKGGAWLYDLYGAGIQFGADITAGQLTGGSALPVMFNRSYGGAIKTAKDEGATDKQAMAYGLAVGGLETATEKVSGVAKPLKKAYGKGLTDDLTNRVIDKMVKKATKKGTKDLAYHGGKTFATALGEGLEEMVSEGLEPSIANSIYANATGTPHSTSVKDVLYSGSIGGALGGILGGGSQVSEYSQGSNVTNIYGEDGVKNLIKKAKDVDDPAGQVRAQALEKMVNEGDGIVAGQANEIYKIVQNQARKDTEKFDIVQGATANILKKNNLQDIVVRDKSGQMVISDNAKQVLEEKADDNVNKIKKQLPDITDTYIAGEIALVQMGAAGIDTMNLFTTSNTEARKAYEAATGETLPATNVETKAYLYKKNAENRVESAKAETDYQMSAVRGITTQEKNITEPAGQEVYSKAVEAINPVNETQALALSDTFDAYHEAGRSGIDFEYVNSLNNPLHKIIPMELRQEMYEAGKSDKITETSNVNGMQLRINEALDKTRSNPKSKARKGTLISELSTENMKALTLQRQSMFRTLAKAFNLELHIVDTLGNGENKVNGFYNDGKVYISMDADRPLEYVFAHEITHHMQQYAPEEYVKLKDLLREKWFDGDMKEVIDSKISAYAESDITLTREEALDEVISDSTYEFLNDENFVDEICKEDTGLARSIITTIKNILRKLRAVFAGQDSYEPKHNVDLLSNLGILSDMEQLWVSGLAKAAVNKDAVGMIDNKPNTDNEYSLKETDSEYLKAVENNDMETAQRMVDEAAKRAGYISDSDYQGTSAFNGSAPGDMGLYDNKEAAIEAWNNEDFEGDWTLADTIDRGIDNGDLFMRLNDNEYRRADTSGKESILNLRNAVDGAKTITMYRSVPADVVEDSFRNGDWITPSKTYADENASVHGWGDDYRVIQQDVSTENIWWDGNDVNEWGYEDANTKAYKNTPNNAKLLDPVTYDNDGNVIPLSERFNENTPDIRYSLPDEGKVFDYIEEHETEFFDATPFRNYEKTGRKVKEQSVNELKSQIEKMKKDKRLTHGKVLDTKSVKEQFNTLVRTLMTRSDGTTKKTNSNLVKIALDNASDMYKGIVSGDVETPALTAYYVAQDIVEGLEFVDDTMYEEYKDFRAYLKDTPLKISEEDKNNIPDFNEFRKKNFGRLRLSNEGVPVDTVYDELCDLYPEMFDDGITHPADQLAAIADARESLEPYDMYMSSDETQQLIKQTAQDILDIVAYGKPWQSWADKQKQRYNDKLKQAKARQIEAREKAIDKVNERWEGKYQEQKQKTSDVKDAERARAERLLAEEKQKQKDKEETKKTTQEHKGLYEDITSNVKWLSDRLLKPTDDKHIPEEFKTAVANMLSGIDLQTNRSKNLESKNGKSQKTLHFEALRRQYAKLANEEGTGVFEYDGYVFELMDALSEKLEGKTIDEATNIELHSISTLLKAIVHNVRTVNATFNDAIKENIDELGKETIDKATKRIEARGHSRKEYTGMKGSIDNILNASMLTPRDLFDYLGGGLGKAFMGLRHGFDKHIDNVTYLRGFFDDLLSDYNKKKSPGNKTEQWRKDKYAQDFTTENGDSIRLSPAQVMSLYCLMKREQAQGHILGAGVVATAIDPNSKVKKAMGAKKEIKGTTTMVSLNDITKIIGTLTPEQISVADKMMELLNEKCQEWGNEASMLLYGYKKFMEDNYFPIQSSNTYLETRAQDLNLRDIVKNYSFTKNTVNGANNPIVIDDIFTVVADHTNKMSLYNALSVPITDFYRLWNYKERNDDGIIETNVKSKVQDAYGKKVNKYIETFLNDVQSNTDNNVDSLSAVVTKALANYKKAAIGANLRVALQQPTAVARALMHINPKYFVNKNLNIVKNTKDMQAHCQIARWKSWGFSNVDMARSMNEIMMNREWSKLDAVTMRPYGLLDDLTWGTIWAAVRKETTKEHPDVKVNSEEFYKICNERATEIFDKTQVVDSVFHRSQIMRQRDIMSKVITSYMAEPTRTFNMVRGNLVLAREMWESGDHVAAVGKANRAISVYVYNAALCAAAAAVADMLREKYPDDDDEDKEGFELWLTNFKNNFFDMSNPLTLIPVVKDIWGFKDGWGTQNMALEGPEALVTAFMGVIDKATGESDKSWDDVLVDMAEGIGSVTGIPIKNGIREVKAIFKAVGVDTFATDILDDKIDAAVSKVKDTFGIKGTSGDKKNETQDEKMNAIYDKVEDMTGSEREEAIWSAVTEGYTTDIKRGKYGSIKKKRQMLEAMGGDVTKFDEAVLKESKTAYKKTIGYFDDYEKRLKIGDYLISQGMTEAQISNTLVAKSERAKEFQIACANGDEANMGLALVDLVNAGISYEDANALYISRYKAIKTSDVATGEFATPVSGEVTSGFGYRNAPTSGASTYHQGVDIAAAENSNVAAADGGKVSSCGYNSGKGNWIKIDHGNGRYTEYYHLNGGYVQKGQPVSKGETIGIVGSTGASTGPHLHFAVIENGQYVDPMSYFN